MRESECERERGGANHLVCMMFEAWSVMVFIIIGGWRADQYARRNNMTKRNRYGHNGKNLGETVVM